MSLYWLLFAGGCSHGEFSPPDSFQGIGWESIIQGVVPVSVLLLFFFGLCASDKKILDVCGHMNLRGLANVCRNKLLSSFLLLPFLSVVALGNPLPGLSENKNVTEGAPNSIPSIPPYLTDIRYYRLRCPVPPSSMVSSEKKILPRSSENRR
jgi:hypothetical protein